MQRARKDRGVYAGGKVDGKNSNGWRERWKEDERREKRMMENRRREKEKKREGGEKNERLEGDQLAVEARPGRNRHSLGFFLFSLRCTYLINIYLCLMFVFSFSFSLAINSLLYTHSFHSVYSVVAVLLT